MVNPNVGGHTKTLSHRKNTPKKTKKKLPVENQKNKKPKYKLSGGPVFAFSLPGARFTSLLPPVSCASA